jgi:hypothetical protein
MSITPNSPEYAKVIDQLSAAYANDHAVREVLNSFVRYKIGKKEVLVDRTHARLEDKTLKRSAVINVLRRLEEEYDLGKFIKGSQGHPSRFLFTPPLNALKVALAATGAPEEEVPDEVVTGDDDLAEHTFRLRADLQITLKLPEDITFAEAKRLSAWIRAIPPDSDGELY